MAGASRAARICLSRLLRKGREFRPHLTWQAVVPRVLSPFGVLAVKSFCSPSEKTLSAPKAFTVLFATGSPNLPGLVSAPVPGGPRGSGGMSTARLREGGAFAWACAGSQRHGEAGFRALRVEQPLLSASSLLSRVEVPNTHVSAVTGIRARTGSSSCSEETR